MQKTKWGGIADDCFRRSGFFRVDERDGVFWLVDPDGGRFLSKGVNTVRFDQDHVGSTNRVPYADTCREKYGSQYIWRVSVANRLASWKFNTLGCRSDELVASAGSSLLATTPTAALGASFRLHRRDEIFPDVFDPSFLGHIRESAKTRCTKRCNEAGLLGTFIDNELYWSPDWRGADELLTLFLNLPAHRPGRVAAIIRLEERYREFSQFNAVWRTPARSWEEFGTIGHVEAPLRTTQFTDEQEDSIITLTLEEVEGGTLVTLVHSNVPDGQTSYEQGGWQEYYFEPMKEYFANPQRAGVGETSKVVPKTKRVATRTKSKHAAPRAKATAGKVKPQRAGAAKTTPKRAKKAKKKAKRKPARGHKLIG